MDFGRRAERGNGMSGTSHEQGYTTKEKIIDCAVKLFAEKGYTETTIRELAEASGLRGGSIYNHFPSKNAILEYILEDYSKFNTDIFAKRDLYKILRESPNSDGVLMCMQLTFPAEKLTYYLNVLCLLFQEQLRNPIVHDYMCEHVLLRSEVNARAIIETLKKIGAVNQDTDPDFWLKATSSIFYTFAARSMLGIGDNKPGFAGMGMVEMLREIFDLLFEKHGAAAQDK